MKTGYVKTLFKAVVVTGLYWIYSRLWFYRRVHFPSIAQSGAPCVYAHWHGDELLLLGDYIGSGMGVMASLSRDGELMGTVLRWLGFSVVRGSSSRGGAGGLKGLIDKAVKEKRSVALAVDGPRGPIYQVKPGVIKLAQQTGAWLVPGVGVASHKFVFKKAWNRCYLPLPFAKCVILYGKPIAVPRELTQDQFEQYREALETELLRLKDEAENIFAQPVYRETCLES